MSYWVCRNGHINDSRLSMDVCTHDMQLGKIGCGAIRDSSALYKGLAPVGSDPSSSTKRETRGGSRY